MELMIARLQVFAFVVVTNVVLKVGFCAGLLWAVVWAFDLAMSVEQVIMCGVVMALCAQVVIAAGKRK